MIKKLSEKIIKLNEKDLDFIENCFITLILCIFILGLAIGNVVGHISEQNKITDKLISLSEKENLPLPDNNYFKIDNKVYEIRKVTVTNEFFVVYNKYK